MQIYFGKYITLFIIANCTFTLFANGATTKRWSSLSRGLTVFASSDLATSNITRLKTTFQSKDQL